MEKLRLGTERLGTDLTSGLICLSSNCHQGKVSAVGPGQNLSCLGRGQKESHPFIGLAVSDFLQTRDKVGIRNVTLPSFLLTQFYLSLLFPQASCWSWIQTQSWSETVPCWWFVSRGTFHPVSFPELPENSGSTPIQLNLGTHFAEIVQVQAVEPHFQKVELLC